MDIAKIEAAISIVFESSARNAVDKNAQDYLTHTLDTPEHKFEFSLEYIFRENQKANVSFWCLQQLVSISHETSILTKYTYEKMILWIRDHSTRSQNMIRNKFSQFVAHVFARDFPQKCPNLFKDLLSIASNANGSRMLLSILEQIFEECFSQDSPHHHRREETERFGKMKDYMKKDIVGDLMNFLASLISSKSELTSMALKILSMYYEWFDFMYLTNAKLIKILYDYVHVKELRHGSVSCLTSIVNRGMPPVDRLKMLQQVQVIEFALAEKENFYDSPFATLLNDLGIVLLEIFMKCTKSNENVEATKFSFEALNRIIPLLFKMYSNTEFTQEVVTFFNEYTNFLGKSKDHPQNIIKQMETLIQISRSLLLKIRKSEENYDEYVNNVARQNKQFVLEWIASLMSSRANPRETAMNLKLFYNLAEAFPADLWRKEGFFHDMFYKILQTDYEDDPDIQTAFFEVFSRYCGLLQYNTKLVPKIQIFVDHHGIRSKDDTVRKCACEQFKKVVKTIRPFLGGFVEDIYRYLKDFLEITYPSKDLVSNEDQVFLYESIGWIISDKNTNTDKAMEILRAICTPIIFQMKELKNNPKSEPFIVQQTNCIAALCRAFANCPPAYHSIMKSIVQIIGLEIFPVFPSVKAKVVLIVKILTPPLKTEILGEVAQILKILFNMQKDVDDLNEIYIIMTELVSKTQGDAMQLCHGILKPLTDKSADYMAAKIDKANLHIYPEILKCQKLYFDFIEIMLSNKCAEVVFRGDFGVVMRNLIKGCHNYDEITIIYASFKALVWVIQLTDFNDLTREILTMCFQTPTKIQMFEEDSKNIMGAPSSILVELGKMAKMAYRKNNTEFLKWLNGITLPTKFKEELVLSFGNEKTLYDTLVNLYK